MQNAYNVPADYVALSGFHSFGHDNGSAFFQTAIVVLDRTCRFCILFRPPFLSLLLDLSGGSLYLRSLFCHFRIEQHVKQSGLILGNL